MGPRSTPPLSTVVITPPYRFGLGPEGLVFSNDSDEPIRRTTFSDIGGRAARPLGIPLGDGFHLLRHYFASVLIHGGAYIVLVQKMLGHASLETTQIYSHLSPRATTWSERPWTAP
jgi:site-specific recombinase XerD